ncbi:hypothetical protein BO86DRAFT_377133 [Aspergillus japonicus CBS 114.51]|uniref:Uncharacterized protein n=1 Tax=Aspergillus japonicus CBS 114.51 TaxID=1448312 RepID=A0A8T8XA28_ASPJA|nr:hypothetical protein BO86DRAFT_377133 [Aspergillus japonicus CBS 114.51]RAH84372.1 hypothetical protein BO86DRAFT_377133 [Aspergillus japonicus CBS 114.51]
MPLVESLDLPTRLGPSLPPSILNIPHINEGAAKACLVEYLTEVHSTESARAAPPDLTDGVAKELVELGAFFATGLHLGTDEVTGVRSGFRTDVGVNVGAQENSQHPAEPGEGWVIGVFLVEWEGRVEEREVEGMKCGSIYEGGSSGDPSAEGLGQIIVKAMAYHCFAKRLHQRRFLPSDGARLLVCL